MWKEARAQRDNSHDSEIAKSEETYEGLANAKFENSSIVRNNRHYCTKRQLGTGGRMPTKPLQRRCSSFLWCGTLLITIKKAFLERGIFS